jgi:hypothetical protein
VLRFVSYFWALSMILARPVPPRGGVSTNTYAYLFGPHRMFRNPLRSNPFAQALFGGSRVSVSGAASDKFAFSVGGGVDIGMLPHLYLRPQVDYVGRRNSGQTLNCTRVSAVVAMRV